MVLRWIGTSGNLVVQFEPLTSRIWAHPFDDAPIEIIGDQPWRNLDIMTALNYLLHSRPTRDVQKTLAICSKRSRVARLFIDSRWCACRDWKYSDDPPRGPCSCLMDTTNVHAFFGNHPLMEMTFIAEDSDYRKPISEAIVDMIQRFVGYNFF
ncbi:unnamed protein product, partial [Mesorhabditis spiculigera]